MSGNFTRRRRQLIVSVVATTTLAGVGIAASGIFAWSPLNCWHEDINIASGQLRRRRFILYCRVSEQVEETWLSQALDRSAASSHWRRVNTFSPGVGHSPHYHFHGALAQVRTLADANEAIPFDRAAARHVAHQLVRGWQLEGSYFGGSTYAEAVAKTAYERLKKGESSVRLADVLQLAPTP